LNPEQPLSKVAVSLGLDNNTVDKLFNSDDISYKDAADAATDDDDDDAAVERSSM